MGARFYDGQPVVCVWDEAKWIARTPMEYRDVIKTFLPSFGGRYVIAKSGIYNYDAWWVVLVGYEKALNFDEVRYAQDGFEPITKNLVEDIIKRAHDIPTMKELVGSLYDR